MYSAAFLAQMFTAKNQQKILEIVLECNNENHDVELVPLTKIREDCVKMSVTLQKMK